MQDQYGRDWNSHVFMSPWLHGMAAQYPSHIYVHPYPPSHPHIHIHTSHVTHIYIHTHAHTHTHIHTHIHTHTAQAWQSSIRRGENFEIIAARKSLVGNVLFTFCVKLQYTCMCVYTT